MLGTKLGVSAMAAMAGYLPCLCLLELLDLFKVGVFIRCSEPRCGFPTSFVKLRARYSCTFYALYSGALSEVLFLLCCQQFWDEDAAEHAITKWVMTITI